ncbi:type I glyceraldehyde-3-phosphate dehydrogenase [Soehngenia saccharolytica]|jgi:glyceraldehyde 3-phosphate dehydrogenase|nr:type I glyceraldehyde-3-phosphate dehydrogenase [Soehngenia saccharolytica]
MALKVGLSGFGRIGRDVTRAWAESNTDSFDIVAINEIGGSIEQMAHLFKYDSIYGKFNGTVETYDEGIIINGKKIKVVAEKDPSKLPWGELGVDVAIDSTGVFKKREDFEKHLQAGAKKLVITAPTEGEDITIVLGVNDDKYDPEKHNIISNASCTTNCLAPIAKVVLNNLGIKKGLMTTVHAYTNDQQVHDKFHKDPRRARAAAENIIPTTTGAAKAVALVLPELKGKLNGFSVRVPVPTVSLVDVVFEVEKPTTAEEVNNLLKQASENELKGILGYSDELLVSRDFLKDKRSSIVDADSTMVIDNMVKIVSWYDNEWGYSNRVVDLVSMIASRW